MTTITISKTTARRYVLGRQGLWPGRRWAGQDGTAEALRAIEAVQMDPLNVVARSHDIVLWSRVSGYRSVYLDHALYQARQFFDYGGALFIYPMTELPYWRLPMRQREREGRWATFAAAHQTLLDDVRAQLRTRGPLGNRDFSGNKVVNNYRGGKDTSLALYYLWLTGELMIHRRQGFERVYDFRDRVAPPALDYSASDEEAEHFFARKVVAFKGLIRERSWANGFSGFIERRVPRTEADQRLHTMVQNGELASVQVEGSKERWFVLSADVPLLSVLETGGIPKIWRPLTTTTNDEIVFLAPLDIVSTRGRASWLFDFEYLWEVYKPAAKRRWGYYTLPILYGDRLVARLDPKLDRSTNTLLINGFWLEERAPIESPAFAAALARGLARFAGFLDVRRVNITMIEPATLRALVAEHIGSALEQV
jgi:uncharacterized protein YcaQ